jgi:phage shock protein C
MARKARASRRKTQKSTEGAKRLPSKFEKNVEHFGKEVEDLGNRIGKKFEESGKRRQSWYDRTFGIAGPFMSGVFAMVIFFIAIWLIGWVNTPIQSEFMADLSVFMLNNTGLFFLAFLLFSYISYFQRCCPRGFMPFCPLAVAAGVTFGFWVLLNVISIANFSIGNPTLFDASFWIRRMLPVIFGVSVLIGYLVLIVRLSMDSKGIERVVMEKHAKSGKGDVHLRRLYRSGKDKILGGVCGGLGEYFGVDPVLFRILFVLLALGWGFGILLYIICWIIIPRNPEQKWGR